MLDSTYLPSGRSSFALLPTCPDWCGGHCDPSVGDHTTDLEHFGDEGVTLYQRDGQPPVIALIDFNPTQHDLTTDRALHLAHQLLRAVDVAQRYASPSPVTRLAQQVGAVLPARDEDEG